MPNIKQFRSDDIILVGEHFNYEWDNLLRSDSLLRLIKQKNHSGVTYEQRPRQGFGAIPKYTGDMNYIKPKRGFNNLIITDEYMGSYDVHYKAYKVDKSGELENCGQDLAQGMAYTISNSVLELFGSAWTKVGNDGKTWAAEDHPIAALRDEGNKYVADASAGTYSNLIRAEGGSTDLALSVKGLDRAWEIANGIPLPDGKPMKGKFDLVLVSPKNRAKAIKLLGQDTELAPKQDPDSAENAASSVHGLKWMVCGYGYGSGAVGLRDNQWAFVDSANLKKVTVLIFTTRPVIDQSYAYPNKRVKVFSVYADFGIGYADWRPILFSNPA